MFGSTFQDVIPKVLLSPPPHPHPAHLSQSMSVLPEIKTPSDCFKCSCLLRSHLTLTFLFLALPLKSTHSFNWRKKIKMKKKQHPFNQAKHLPAPQREAGLAAAVQRCRAPCPWLPWRHASALEGRPETSAVSLALSFCRLH